MKQTEQNTITNKNKPALTINNTVKIFLGLLLLIYITYYSGIVVPTVHAEGISLKLSPSVLQVHALPASTVDAPFTVENVSNDSVNLKIGYKIINKDLSQEGIITFLNDGETFPGPDKTFFWQNSNN